MIEPLAVSIESLAEQHPAMNADLLVEHARVALSWHHASPAEFIFWRALERRTAKVEFRDPDPRSQDTLEREKFAEFGAIVMAGVVLCALEGKQLTRVVGRGKRVDYFVGEQPGEFRWILEVGGTDEGDFQELRGRKRRQLESSPYRGAPHFKEGYVSATRFAPQAATCADHVPSS